MRGASAGGGTSSFMRSGPDCEAGADRPRSLAQIDRAGHWVTQGTSASQVERDATAGERGSEPKRRALLLHLGRRETEGKRAPTRAGTHLDGTLPQSRPEDVGAHARIPALADRQRRRAEP